VVERWNNLEQHVVDALNIISFKNKLKQIRETRMGFLWIPAKPYEPHLCFRLQNDLYCVGWGVKLYSLIQPHLWLDHS